MKRFLFKGCGTAIVTPFLDNGTINFEQMRKLINFQILEGVDAIIVCGTTGESSTLSMEEKKSLIDFCVKIIRKRVPLIAGTGGNNTKEVIELTKYASEVGANGLLIVTPYYNKTSTEGLINHYKAICEHTNLPIILYNVPSRTGVNLDENICLELSKFSNIIGIKEASRKYISSR